MDIREGEDYTRDYYNLDRLMQGWRGDDNSGRGNKKKKKKNQDDVGELEATAHYPKLWCRGVDYH